jgi:hypothetical protein
MQPSIHTPMNFADHFVHVLSVTDLIQSAKLKECVVSNPPHSVCNSNMRKRGRSAPIWRKKAWERSGSPGFVWSITYVCPMSYIYCVCVIKLCFMWWNHHLCVFVCISWNLVLCDLHIYTSRSWCVRFMIVCWCCTLWSLVRRIFCLCINGLPELSKK